VNFEKFTGGWVPRATAAANALPLLSGGWGYICIICCQLVVYGHHHLSAMGSTLAAFSPSLYLPCQVAARRIERQHLHRGFVEHPVLGCAV
jgi:hypothetical protein